MWKSPNTLAEWASAEWHLGSSMSIALLNRRFTRRWQQPSTWHKFSRHRSSFHAKCLHLPLLKYAQMSRQIPLFPACVLLPHFTGIVRLVYRKNSSVSFSLKHVCKESMTMPSNCLASPFQCNSQHSFGKYCGLQRNCIVLLRDLTFVQFYCPSWQKNRFVHDLRIVTK